MDTSHLEICFFFLFSVSLGLLSKEQIQYTADCILAPLNAEALVKFSFFIDRLSELVAYSSVSHSRMKR